MQIVSQNNILSVTLKNLLTLRSCEIFPSQHPLLKTPEINKVIVCLKHIFFLFIVRKSIPLTEMELCTKWEQALGPQYDVMVRNGK